MAALPDEDLTVSPPKPDVSVLVQQVGALNDQIQTLLVSPNQILSDAIQRELAQLLQAINALDAWLHRPNRSLGTQQAIEVQCLVRTVGAAVAKVGADGVTAQGAYRMLRAMRVSLVTRVRSLRSPLWAPMGNFGDAFCQSASMSVKVLVGMLIALPLYVGMPLGLITALEATELKLKDIGLLRENYEATATEASTLYDRAFKETSLLLILCWICGSTGSMVSILSRLSDYHQEPEQEHYDDSVVPVLVGMFKPVIGGAFGALIFSLMASGLIPIAVANDDNATRTELKWLTFMAVAFTIGFSERLSKDVLVKAESVLGSEGQATGPPTEGSE
ncbi:MAG: hypothetical protein O3C67_09050 [Cyanobacteria bacterium]|nr:hypothetical protein [Cyanobacteriota bacterium]